jgi:hypothetical protein
VDAKEINTTNCLKVSGRLLYLSLNIAYYTSLVTYYRDLALNSPGVKLPLYIVFGPHIDCKHNLLARIFQSNLDQPITNPKGNANSC